MEVQKNESHNRIEFTQAASVRKISDISISTHMLWRFHILRNESFHLRAHTTTVKNRSRTLCGSLATVCGSTKGHAKNVTHSGQTNKCHNTVSLMVSSAATLKCRSIPKQMVLGLVTSSASFTKQCSTNYSHE